MRARKTNGLNMPRTPSGLQQTVLCMRGAVAIALLWIAGVARADVAWIPMRDENPFVLGVGIPLLPQPAPASERALSMLTWRRVTRS